MIQAKNSKVQRLLNTEKIVNTALKLADNEGIDALSMRKLAGILGVTAMSLYNHVEGKDGLLNLMLSRVVEQIEIPANNAQWDEKMRHRAHSMRRLLLRHRWAATLLISKINLGAEIMRDINATLGCLVNAGFTYAQADWARNAIDSHVYGYTMQELNIPVKPNEYKSAASQYLPVISKVDYPYLHAASVQIIEGDYDGINSFDFGLELILDGLKRWLEKL